MSLVLCLDFWFSPNANKLAIAFYLHVDCIVCIKLHNLIGLGQFGFFKFGSVRFGFQSQVLGFVFF